MLRLRELPVRETGYMSAKRFAILAVLITAEVGQWVLGLATGARLVGVPVLSVLLLIGVVGGSRLAWLALVIQQALFLVLGAHMLTAGAVSAANYVAACLVELVTVSPAVRRTLDPGWWHRRRKRPRTPWRPPARRPSEGS